MIYDKIKKMTQKTFSSKTYVLMGVNKFIPEHFGKVTDLVVDRTEKNIYVSLDKKEDKAKLSILGYHIIYKGTQPYLAFNKLHKDGFLNDKLGSLIISKEIAIDSKYIKLVQRMV